jgi:hypothetical protein
VANRSTDRLPPLQGSIGRWAGLASASTRCHLPKRKGERTGHLLGESGCDVLRLGVDHQQLKPHTNSPVENGLRCAESRFTVGEVRALRVV